MLAVGADSGAVQAAASARPTSTSQQAAATATTATRAPATRRPVWVTGEVLVAAAGDRCRSRSRAAAARPSRRKQSPSLRSSGSTVPAPERPPSAAPPPATPPAGAAAASAPARRAAVPGTPGRCVRGRTQPAPSGGRERVQPEGEGPGLTEATPAAAIEPPAKEARLAWIPIGIGLGVAAIALIAPWLLGKRYAW